MKKKLLMLAIAVTVSFTGCSIDTESTSVESQVEMEGEEPSFVIVEQTKKWSIVYHKDTKVMYVAPHGERFTNGTYRYNDFTVMLDSEGKPLLYEEVE